MSPLKILLAVLLLTGGLGAGLTLASRAIDSLHPPPPAPPRTDGQRHERSRPKHRRAHPRRPRRHDRATRRGTPTATDAAARSPVGQGGLTHPRPLRLALLAAIEFGVGVVLLGGVLVVLVLRRMRQRRRRPYGLYELHLSTHDEAKPQDLEDMVESIANVIRAFPRDRACNGQPFVALELICGAGQDGIEWSINLRCEPASVRALDAAISAAYPDVRVGRRHAEVALPRPGALRVPGHVMRFRKQRSFVYALVAPDEALASPPLEQIALAQVALQAPSVVRFQLTPSPSFFEELARRRYRRHENKLVRQERWGLPEGGLSSTLNRAEMANAQRTQNRSLFWLEVVVAADTPQDCKTLAAAVQARRGENRLHRRLMLARQNLYRRRFPHALAPPLPSLRCLVSAAEAAHLLALPSARMKGVPVRRLTLPRIPAPPEAMRATDGDPVPAPAEHAVAARHACHEPART